MNHGRNLNSVENVQLKQKVLLLQEWITKHDAKPGNSEPATPLTRGVSSDVVGGELLASFRWPGSSRLLVLESPITVLHPIFLPPGKAARVLGELQYCTWGRRAGIAGLLRIKRKTGITRIVYITYILVQRADSSGQNTQGPYYD